MTASSDQLNNLSYILSVSALTLLLVWGLRQLTRELRKIDPKTGRTLMAEALTEKAPSNVNDSTRDQTSSASFSRIAGSIGAVGLSATFVAVGYWAIHELHYGNDIEKISSLSQYFLSGSALFIPYGFNLLSSVFKQ